MYSPSLGFNNYNYNGFGNYSPYQNNYGIMGGYNAYTSSALTGNRFGIGGGFGGIGGFPGLGYGGIGGMNNGAIIGATIATAVAGIVTAIASICQSRRENNCSNDRQDNSREFSNKPLNNTDYSDYSDDSFDVDFT
jgi:hypothetical protein